MPRRPAKIPHRSISSTPVHLTFRLFGSLPKSILSILEQRKDSQLALLAEQYAGIDASGAQGEWKRQQFMVRAHYELAVERALEEDSNGPFHLTHVPEVGRMVLEAWTRMQATGKIRLHAVCIMPNHIHIVLQKPEGAADIPIGPFLKSQKGFTGRKANELLGLTGRPFWEKNYFDRDVRPGKFDRLIRYVLENPVAAGLADDWRNWELTWLHPELWERFGGGRPRPTDVK